MAYLINRNPPARAQCLHAMCQFVSKKLNKNNFSMNEIKFNSDEINIHEFCTLLKKDEDLGIKYCPYKSNPLSKSGCGLTNGVSEDTTKSKEVSNTVNAMHSIGLFERRNKQTRITELGITFSKTKIYSKEYFSTFREGVLKSGLMIGLLGQLYLMKSKKFQTNNLNIGYPNNSQEVIEHDNERVLISSGSEKDSNTRTKSCLLSWGIISNFFLPEKLVNRSINDINEYIISSNRNEKNFEISNFPYFIFKKIFFSEKPLDYKNLTKNTGALRENNQEKVRQLTLQVEHKIQNRRLAIVLGLHDSYIKKKPLDIDLLIKKMKFYKELFVVNELTFETIIEEEINIGFACGIPFSIDQNNKLNPIVGINIKELIVNVPDRVIKVIESFFNEKV
jgi:hypothetical protein